MFTKMRVNRAVECIRGQVSSALEVELKQHAVEVPVSVCAVNRIFRSVSVLFLAPKKVPSVREKPRVSVFLHFSNFKDFRLEFRVLEIHACLQILFNC